MMSRFISRLRRTTGALALNLVLFSVASPAWAQDAAQTGIQADWVMSYALVILSVGLGVFVVCRPGRRSQDIRRPLE